MAKWLSERALTWGSDMFPETPALSREKQNAGQMMELITMRHPDPRLIDSLQVTEPRLQVNGTWVKLEYSKGKVPRPRDGCSAWIWQSKLYVAGGEDHKHVVHADLW